MECNNLICIWLVYLLEAFFFGRDVFLEDVDLDLLDVLVLGDGVLSFFDDDLGCLL